MPAERWAGPECTRAAGDHRPPQRDGTANAVGNGLIGDTFWLIAERGEQADYVHNIRATPRVRVKIGRRWRTGTAAVLPDDDTQARQRQILAHHGMLRAADAALLRGAVKTLATTPVTVRIDLDYRAA